MINAKDLVKISRYLKKTSLFGVFRGNHYVCRYVPGMYV